MKLIVNAFFALCFILALAFTTQSAVAADPAYMVIRFNQKNFNYHDKLAYAVREALKTKSNVVFEVVDVTTGTPALYGQQIASDIENLGVPAAQVTMSSQNGDVSNEEVRIFVR